MDALRTRPTAETFTLDDLVQLARSGSLRVPSFQRGLRWTRREVVLLFDSILKGYPIGSLLLWERDAPAEVVELGPLRIEAPAGPAYYVVDGQQRITALVSALVEAGWSDQRFAVGYDLDADAFAPRPPRDMDAWIPAHVLYDLSALLLWFRDRPDLVDRFEAAAAVSGALRDFRLIAHVVRQDDEEVVRSIFDRINHAGSRLTRAEVFAAIHGSSAASDGMTLKVIAERIAARTGFGTPDDELVLRMVLARRGPDLLREIRDEFKPHANGRDAFAAGEPASEAYQRSEDAAVRAVRFLQDVAAVPHQALLPHQYLLVTLERFFAHHPEPSARHQRLLRRFFWRAVVSGPSLIPGNTTGVSRMLNRKVDPGDELASITGLMSTVAGGHPAYPPVDPFRTNTAASKVLLCVLWQQRPRSLTSGQLVGDEDLRAALGDRQTAIGVVTPILSRLLAAGHEQEAGNRLLLVAEEDRETDVMDVLGHASDEALISHVLEPDDPATLRTARAPQVLRERAQRLTHLQRGFLDRMCEWDQEDSPDLAMLAAEAGRTVAPA